MTQIVIYILYHTKYYSLFLLVLIFISFNSISLIILEFSSESLISISDGFSLFFDFKLEDDYNILLLSEFISS